MVKFKLSEDKAEPELTLGLSVLTDGGVVVTGTDSLGKVWSLLVFRTDGTVKRCLSIDGKRTGFDVDNRGRVTVIN